MNILFLTRLFYPHVGGVEKHVFEISKRLVEKGHTVTIVTEKLPGTKEHEVCQDIQIYRIPGLTSGKRKKFVIWQWMRKHRILIDAADVVHCHDVFFWYLPFRFLYPQKKVFTTFHGYESYPIRRKAILLRKLSEVLSRGNICIGDFIKKWYGTKPDYISYGAVDSSKFKVQSSKLERESAVFFGRLDEQTGIRTYVDIYKQLKKQRPAFQFTVVGDGPDEKYLPGEVVHKGFDPNVEKYLEKHNFAFVSRYLSILEAMAAKRLVVAVYDNPVKRDYLKLSPMARFMIISDSPQEIAGQINFYLDHTKNEHDHIQLAYDFVKKQTWEKMVEMYLKLWNK